MGIIINGKKYEGQNLSIINNRVIIDGKDVTDKDDDSKVINIHCESDINSIEVDNCNKLEVLGDAGHITTTNGNVIIGGNVSGDVKTTNGNVKCENINGSVSTKNGNVIRK